MAASAGLTAPITDGPPDNTYANFPAAPLSVSKAKILAGVLGLGAVVAVAAITTTSGAVPAADDGDDFRDGVSGSLEAFTTPPCGCTESDFVVFCEDLAVSVLDLNNATGIKEVRTEFSHQGLSSPLMFTLDISSNTYIEFACGNSGADSAGFVASATACGNDYYTTNPTLFTGAPVTFWLEYPEAQANLLPLQYNGLDYLNATANHPALSANSTWVWNAGFNNSLTFKFDFATMMDTCAPTASPTESPTTASPSASPSAWPTVSPTSAPSRWPTTSPTGSPSAWPTASPSAWPTFSPTAAPTGSPVPTPPTVLPTSSPTLSPTTSPTRNPTAAPTTSPTASPTESTASPTLSPTPKPTTWNNRGLAELSPSRLRHAESEF